MDDTLSSFAEAEAVVEPLPSLPLEIIHHIIELSLPPIRFETFSERYELLRTFSLLSKSWTSWAQTELGRHVCADTRKGCRALERALKEPGQTTIARRAQSLRLSCVDDRWAPTDLRRLLWNLPGCEEVWLWLRGFSNEASSLALAAPKLKRLYLNVAVLRATPAVPTFSSLAELYITEPFDTNRTLAFLDETSFPVLRSLGLASWRNLAPLRHAPLINEILRRLGPHLKRFLFTLKHQREFRALDLDWSHFTSLRSLTLEIPNAGNLVEVLRRLPAKLVTLRLLESSNTLRRGLLELVRECPEAMSTLQTLTLPWCPKAERTEIERLCAQRGTSVVYRNVDMYGWEEWEDLVFHP
ncbi:hypothetical protein BCR35DRAFT_301985, partial [Leucosporidium creatinivorum]